MTERHIPHWTRGDRIRKARKCAGLTVEQVAEELGVTDRTVLNYETDRTPPRRGTLKLIAEMTSVPVEWLEDDDDVPTKWCSFDAPPGSFANWLSTTFVAA